MLSLGIICLRENKPKVWIYFEISGKPNTRTGSEKAFLNNEFLKLICIPIEVTPTSPTKRGELMLKRQKCESCQFEWLASVSYNHVNLFSSLELLTKRKKVVLANLILFTLVNKIAQHYSLTFHTKEEFVFFLRLILNEKLIYFMYG